jgi:hypothetical protein
VVRGWRRLAGRVAAFEQDDHLLLGGIHPVLQFHELGLQAEQLLKIVAAIVPLALAIGAPIGEIGQGMVVLDVHLDLFVPTVEKIAADTLDELLVVEWRLGAHAGSSC